MGMGACSHAFCISIIFHRRLCKVVVYCRQHASERIESRVEKHLMGLYFKRTKCGISQLLFLCLVLPYSSTFRWNVCPGVFDGSTVKESDKTDDHQQRSRLKLSR